MTKESFDRYADIKAQIKALEEEADSLRPGILAEMRAAFGVLQPPSPFSVQLVGGVIAGAVRLIPSAMMPPLVVVNAAPIVTFGFVVDPVFVTIACLSGVTWS